MPRASASDHEALGISPESPPSEIRRAFAAKAKIHHPDKGGDPAHFVQLLKSFRRAMEAAGEPVHHEVRVSLPLADLIEGCVPTVRFGDRGMAARFEVPPMTPSGTTLEFKAECESGPAVVAATVIASGEAEGGISARDARRMAKICRRALTESGNPARLGTLEVPSRVIVEFGAGRGAPAMRIGLETRGMDG